MILKIIYIEMVQRLYDKISIFFLGKENTLYVSVFVTHIIVAINSKSCLFRIAKQNETTIYK